MAALVIRNARRINPDDGTDERGDLYIKDGRIAEGSEISPSEAAVFDADGRIVVPALIDLHVHLREPGNEAAETTATGLRAARMAGFGVVVAMPNTIPPIDTPEHVRAALRRAAAVEDGAILLQSACLTRSREGRAVADLEALAAAGASAFTDDGSTPPEDVIMREAMDRAAALGLPILDHAQDPTLERRGVMHEGRCSQRRGVPGIPAAAEIRIIERDIRLARETGARVHIQHVSTAEGVACIRAARAEGLPVSGETTPHHLTWIDEDVRLENPNFKVNPPLRSRADREALIQGVLEGTLSCLATDHAPHTIEAKARGFEKAPPGMVGLETAIGVTWTRLVIEYGMPPIEWLRRWTTGPAAVLGLPPPSLRPGVPADLVLLDVTTPWTVRADWFLSKSRNTPFMGHKLWGRAVAVWKKGRQVREVPWAS